MNTREDLVISTDVIRRTCDEVSMPPLGVIEQVWETEPISGRALETHVEAAVDGLAFADVPAGGEIAIGVGSRGIANLPALVEHTVAAVRTRGYEPFVFPAMGSHGGATADGQTAMLAELGVTTESVGCEIRATMETVEIGRTAERDVPVVTDAYAADADGILPLNRIKPHTDYEGPIESGLAKMLVIGMGNQRGAKLAHSWAIDWSLSRMIPELTAHLLEALPIVGGVAIIEDQHDDTGIIEGIRPETLLDRERTLQRRAADMMPRLPFDEIDLLVLDRQGKNISGQGLDPNVTGQRPYAINEPDPPAPDIKRIYVRSLTPATHGNAMGVGSADFIHQDLLAALSSTDTVVNAITAGTVRGVRLPIIIESDEAALIAALSSVGVAPVEELRIVRARDTAHLDRLAVSPVLVEEARSRDDLVVHREPEAISFDSDGNFAESIGKT